MPCQRSRNPQGRRYPEGGDARADVVNDEGARVVVSKRRVILLDQRRGTNSRNHLHFAYRPAATLAPSRGMEGCPNNLTKGGSGEIASCPRQPGATRHPSTLAPSPILNTADEKRTSTASRRSRASESHRSSRSHQARHRAPPCYQCLRQPQ